MIPPDQRRQEGRSSFRLPVTMRLARTGRALAYGGTAWRGRSSGSGPASIGPGDPANAAQEAMLIAPDGASVDGRWFWGQYEELGFDVKM